MTGTLQNYARKHVIAIDRLSFRYELHDDKTYKDIKEKPGDGCYIYGMYIEGCKWDNRKHQLGDSDPKKLFTDIPLLLLVPQQDRLAPKSVSLNFFNNIIFHREFIIHQCTRYCQERVHCRQPVTPLTSL